MRSKLIFALLSCSACVIAQSHGAGSPGSSDLAVHEVVPRDVTLDLADLEKRASRSSASRRKAAARKAAAVAAARRAAAKKAAARKAAAARAAAARRHGSHHSPAPAPARRPHHAPAPSPPKKPSGGTKQPHSGNALLTSTHTGDATFFTVGLGACGWTNNDNDPIVAVSHILYDEYPGATANPNNNPICGKKVQTTYNGVTQTMTVVDKCMGCAEFDLDFSPTAFAKMAPLSAGRLPGMTWHFL